MEEVKAIEKLRLRKCYSEFLDLAKYDLVVIESIWRLIVPLTKRERGYREGDLG